MKKLLVIAFALLCATTLIVQAQDAGTNTTATAKSKKHLTPEQQAVMTEMLAKYDTNHDGKLDKTERAAMTKEDKEKMAKVGLGPKKKKAATTDSSTAAPAAAAPATGN
jgi:ABC-type transporter MlaC component